MKCLEKNRDRRYETASGIARDIERYLHDEPVQACPPSAGYRLRKFVRRNKVPVLAASLVLLAVIAGSVGTAISVAQARRAAVEKEAKERAEAREAQTKAVLEFVENKIFAVDWDGGPGGLGWELKSVMEPAKRRADDEGRPAGHTPPLAGQAGAQPPEQFGRVSKVAGGPGKEGDPLRGFIAGEVYKLDCPGLGPLLIALVPHPLEVPPTRFDFDFAVDAIQRAGERHGYVLDRFWYPWNKAGKDAGRVYERQLGVLVFRKPAAHPAQFLVVFLASDIAIHGMHK
jgi:hypothetical protein